MHQRQCLKGVFAILLFQTVCVSHTDFLRVLKLSRLLFLMSKLP